MLGIIYEDNLRMKINWQLWLVIGIFIGTVVILVLIDTLSKKNKLTNTSPTMINPVNNPLAKDCLSERVACNPKDPSSCSKSCNNVQEMKCVILDNITSPEGKAINGGGYVCLEDYPTIKCNIDKGGVYVWTGYGFTNNQTWDCYCMYPEFFGGPGCETVNPDICAGGTVDVSKLNGSEPTSDICTCPPGTTLLLRGDTNTPYCESTDPSKGGGMYGLAGNLHSSPDWRNVLFRKPVVSSGSIAPETTTQWATDIVQELTASYDPGNPTTQGLVKTVQATLDGINSSQCINCDPYGDCSNYCTNHAMSNITQPIANTICQNICPNACTGVCNCSSGTAIWSDETSTLKNKAQYTYDQLDLPPEDTCGIPPLK
jgi:hypothetical protein